MISTIKLFLSIILCSCFVNSIIAQETKLSKEQMLEDFDQAINHINSFAVHKDLNAVRLSIDYEKVYRTLRNEISANTTDCEFRDILKRAVGLVQDAHCNFMGSEYLTNYGKYQKRINFSENQTFEKVAYYENKCDEQSTSLKLPIIYNEGKYFVYSDFKYKNTLIKRHSEVTKYNNINITDFIKSNYDKVGVVRWDTKLKIPYKESFYQKANNTFTLEFRDTDTLELAFSLHDTISYITPKQRDLNFFSQSKKQVLYFKEPKMFYIGMPFMDEELGKSIVQDIDSIVAKGNSFTKIVIDIRGNGGGNDMCYRHVIQHLISNEIPFNLDLRFKYNKPAIDFYKEDQENIKPEKVSLLNDEKYWIKNYDINKIEPDSNTIAFDGKIYVLQDEFIFSSASNLSSLCLKSDQLISVGVSNDLVGGLQTEPLFVQLDNSGLVFRVEPTLDFSDVKSINDFMHNQVEVKVPSSVDDYFLRTTYEGDIYSPEFLLTHDKLIKYVLHQ